MVYSTRRFVVCLSVCHFVLVFFSPFSIAITSLGEERANLSAFRTFVWFVLVWICRFPLPLGVWEGLRFVIVALPGLFSYPFFMKELQNDWNLSAAMDFNKDRYKTAKRMLTDLLSFSNINKYTKWKQEVKRMCLNGVTCRETHQVKSQRTAICS